MATFLRTDGTTEQLKPANGVHWSLVELQTLVGGYIEVVRTKDRKWLVIDEDGKNKNKMPNYAATQLFLYGEFDIILGDALLVNTKLELDGPEDGKEEC
jgi:hypothetical protein